MIANFDDNYLSPEDYLATERIAKDKHEYIRGQKRSTGSEPAQVFWRKNRAAATARPPPGAAAGKYVDRSWEYINGSQTHECRNWD